MSFELVLFLAIAGLAVFFAIGMLLSENAVHSALFLIGNFGCVAVLYLMLNAPFIGMVQVAVYAGAIMVLFLFVIMLLGAEDANDTSRQFKWLTGSATVLALSLLISLALPIVLNGVDMPEYQGRDPMVRVVHAANTVGIEAVDVTLSREGADDVVLEGVAFADISDFLTVEPGTYTVTISPSGAATPLLREEVTLNPDDVITATAYGTFDLNLGLDGQTFALAALPTSFDFIEGGDVRAYAFNAFSDEPVALVDLGPDQVLTVGQRTVDGESEPTTAIFDPVLIDAVPFGEASELVNLPARTYTLAFVRLNGLSTSTASENIIMTLQDYTFQNATEQPLILAAEPPAIEGASVRPRVLDRDQNELTIKTGDSFGSPRSIGQILFTDYLLPVNLVGFLLLVALVGVIVLTRPEGLEKSERRSTRRRRVSRPLVSVIMQQTGSEVVEDTPRLDSPASGD